MGQNVSTLQEYTPETKPPKKENYRFLENPKNENEDNELNERESENAMQKKMGINVLKKHSKMPLKMESFIIDAIIVKKLEHSGKFSDMAQAIAEKLEGQYGGSWNVLISKTMTQLHSGYSFSAKAGSDIRLRYDSYTFTVFKSE
jgi:hypothetical protein